MRLTVKRKIGAGVAIVVLLGAVALVSVYQGLMNLHNNLLELDERVGPAFRAAYELEINLLELAAHVFGYMERRDPAELARIANDRREFEHFQAEYLRFSTSQRSSELAARVEQLYRQFVKVADGMIANRDAESARFAQVMQNIEQLDETLDDQLEARIDRSAPGALEKLVDSIDLEADVGEVGIWLANYRQSRREEDRNRIWSNVDEFREQLTTLRGNPYLTPRERRVVTTVAAMFDDTVRALGEVLAYDAEVVRYHRRFEALRNELDDLLDEEIQALALASLDQPIVEADDAVRAAAARAGLLSALFLLCACAVAALLIMNVTRAVSRLMAGTEAVRRGDLGARIDVRGRDELADLATHFNQMVERLEATTVSKEALAASESRLRATNEELRAEISERQRAEAAERGLRAELQRTELLARMGSLVAGVAHEARNPLFGISSTIDAIEARLTRRGDQSTYADHLTVLRREITRLSTLTRDLLEYGKPSRIQASPVHIDDVLERAMHACHALAEQAGVTMSRQVAADVDTVMLDPDRMIQVFQNLLENAIQHAPRGTAVTVAVRRIHEDDRTWVKCEVIDQGPGISAEDLPRIFEPFFSRRARGTGLGLSIVDRIVEQHGGRTTARNAAAGGAILTVDLPADSTFNSTGHAGSPWQQSAS